ncbi:hypothetical protein PTKIN_Ptkin17bG0090500 [Pterospermum kingtungense]
MESSAVSRNMPSLMRDRHMFDDSVMIMQIISTHTPGGREIDVRPILHIVEDILLRADAGMGKVKYAFPTISMLTMVWLMINTNNFAIWQHMETLESLDERDRSSGFEQMLELLSFTISQISCEIAYKCSVGGEKHAKTVDICNLITSYTWDAKVVLALAAFAVNYGEFWLVVQLYAANPLAKGIALLKQLPELVEPADLLKQRFEALTSLIKAMLQVANCIVEFKELPSQYIRTEDSVLSTAITLFPTAVYWTIRSAVACTSQILGLVGRGHKFLVSTTEAWELSGLAHKVSSIHSHLMQQLNLCHQHVDEKRQIEAYQTLVRLFETTHIDNMKILKALIYAKDDLAPLFDGMTKRREDLSILMQLFEESRTRAQSQYEVVWIPLTEPSASWNEDKQRKFEDVQASMPWHSVHHPSIIDPAVIRYMKEVWCFNKKPLVVVLDPQGKVVNPNAST